MTPADIASILTVGYEHVLDLIRAGRLKAVNVSVRNSKARNRISGDALEQFLRDREAVPAIAATPRTRRPKLDRVTKYF